MMPKVKVLHSATATIPRARRVTTGTQTLPGSWVPLLEVPDSSPRLAPTLRQKKSTDHRASNLKLSSSASKFEPPRRNCIQNRSGEFRRSGELRRSGERQSETLEKVDGKVDALRRSVVDLIQMLNPKTATMVKRPRGLKSIAQDSEQTISSTLRRSGSLNSQLRLSIPGIARSPSWRNREAEKKGAELEKIRQSLSVLEQSYDLVTEKKNAVEEEEALSLFERWAARDLAESDDSCRHMQKKAERRERARKEEKKREAAVEKRETGVEKLDAAVEKNNVSKDDVEGESLTAQDELFFDSSTTSQRMEDIANSEMFSDRATSISHSFNGVSHPGDLQHYDDVQNYMTPNSQLQSDKIRQPARIRPRPVAGDGRMKRSVNARRKAPVTYDMNGHPRRGASAFGSNRGLRYGEGPGR